MVTAAVVCLCAVWAAQAKAAPEPGTPLVPVMTMTGDQSRMAGPRVIVCGDQKSLDGVWTAHTGARAKVYYSSRLAPLIDFKRYMAVFVFSGPGVNSQGLKFESAEGRGNSVLIRYSDLTFQTMYEPQIVQTWIMAVLSRSPNGIIVEHGTRDRIGGRLSWKKQAEVRLGDVTDSYREGRGRFTGSLR